MITKKKAAGDKSSRPMNGSKAATSKQIDSDKYTLSDFATYKSPDIFMKAKMFARFLESFERKRQAHYHVILLSPVSNRVRVMDPATRESREMIMFASSLYLNLNMHPKVIEAVKKAAEKWGTGTTASVTAGKYDVLRSLEKRIARMKGYEDALLFTSGYPANVGVISSLAKKDDVILVDRMAHVSSLDGCKLSGAKEIAFSHNNMGSLEGVLKYSADKFDGKLVVLDAISNLHCDMAPLTEVMTLARNYGARVYADDVLGFGSLGARGLGTDEHFGILGQLDLTLVSFSKALSCEGAAVVGSKEAIDYIKWYARSAAFSTSMSPIAAAGVHAALDILEQEPQHLTALRKNVSYMRTELANLGFTVGGHPSTSAVPVILNSHLKLRRMHQKLFDLGVYVIALEYPGAPIESPRFRMGMMSTHTQRDLDRTLDAFQKAGKSCGVIK